MNKTVRSHWHAFPDNKNAKLLIDTSGRIKTARSLWHPYSASGKAAKLFLALIPRIVLRQILPKYIDQETLQQHYNVACRVLGLKNIHLHFSTGTPGPHRKTTAQIVDKSDVVSYVKIARSKAAKILFLSKLPRADVTRFMVETVYVVIIRVLLMMAYMR